MRYICIDLKSFYASVECVDRGLDPLDTNLVVADESRTEKTICLAVTPSLKAFGIPGRPRLFEVIQKVKDVNIERRKRSGCGLSGSSYIASELKNDPSLKLDFIIAPPQMARYMSISTEIYKIYLKYVAPEDILVYSIDEVFIDAGPYLEIYKCTAHEFAMMMIREILGKTKITAAAGVGTNLYLAKIAMDIVAKRIPADKDGVRIAELDEMTYRRTLWNHRPLTDFWRVGSGTVKRLSVARLYTMGDIARYSEYNEDKLYEMFGVNAELLIDHAWGWEPCTIADVRSYRPENQSISRGQVLSEPYKFDKARLVCYEMIDGLVLELCEKRISCDQLVLTVGYDHTGIPKNYSGILEKNRYGKRIPKAAHGSINIGIATSSSKMLADAAMGLFDRIVNRELLVRRMYIVANHVFSGEIKEMSPLQYSLFDDTDTVGTQRVHDEKFIKKERELQNAMLTIKDRYGKNAILRGMNFLEGATAIERNGQVGGHKA